MKLFWSLSLKSCAGLQCRFVDLCGAFVFIALVALAVATPEILLCDDVCLGTLPGISCIKCSFLH